MASNISVTFSGTIHLTWFAPAKRALIGFGVETSHGYERIQDDALECIARHIIAYSLSLQSERFQELRHNTYGNAHIGGGCMFFGHVRYSITAPHK